ncbi:MAG: hypothetical protein Q9213_005657 [Squamulea squamosa]
MVLGLYLIILVLAIAKAWARGRVALRGSPVPSPTYAFHTVIEEILGLPSPTAASDFPNRAKEANLLNVDRLTIRMTNGFGENLPISYNSNAGSPTIFGKPSTETFLAGTENTVVVPRGFAGAFFIGRTFNPSNSKIEVSFSPPQDYRPGVDVSYVDGYSVPITCSCGGVTVTGCNIPLFRTGRTCPLPGAGTNLVCYNPKKVINGGPADSFFQPCQGAAYTYPDDHQANGFGKCDSGNIYCCVGVNCPAPRQQHGKRSLEERGFANETGFSAGVS